MDITRTGSFALTLFLASLFPFGSLWALHPQDLERAKAATIFVKAGAGTGTAFCIDASKGLFLTNYHVVEYSPSLVTLIANPGTASKAEAKATVLLADPENDLALLKAVFEIEIPALPLGFNAELTETDVLTAFGYPFGMDLASDGISPAVSVNIGRITSLRKKDGKLTSIQTDASVNRGNSGGPMLSENGDVVGIVRSGYGGAGLNFAIPSEVFTPFLEKPYFQIEIGGHGPVDFGVKNEFFVHVETVRPSEDEYTFDYFLDSRALDSTETDKNTYWVEIPPQPIDAAKEESPSFRVVSRLKGKIVSTLKGKVRSTGSDRPVENTFTLIEVAAPIGTPPLESGLPVPPPSDFSEILALSPANRLTEEKSIIFDEPFSSVVPGGHGRYLVFYFPGSREIRVFDLASLEFTGDPIVIGSGDLLVAAGGYRIVAISVFENRAYSMPFDTLEIDKSKNLPWTGTPFRIEIGRSANQYAVISYKSGQFSDSPHMRPYFLDLKSLEPAEIDVDLAPELEETRIRSNADGNVLTFSNNDCVGTSAVLNSGKLIYRRNTIRDRGWKIPSLAGTHLLKCCGEVQTLLGQRISYYPARRKWLFHHLPSGHPGFYVRIGSKEYEEDDGHEIALIPNGETRPVLSLEGRFEDLDKITKHDFRFDRFSWDEGDLSFDRRVYLIPQLGLLATLPTSNNSIKLRPIAFDASNDTDSAELRYVSSVAPTKAKLGSTYRYQLEWNPSAENVRFVTVTAPSKLNISETGLVTWNPVEGESGRSHKVVIRLTGSHGKSRFHSFNIYVEDK